MSRYSIITDAFDRTKADSDQQGTVPRLRDKLMRGLAWVRAVNNNGNLHTSQQVKNVGEFNQEAMSRSKKYGNLMLRFDGNNQTGVFKVVYKNDKLYCVSTRADQTPAYPLKDRDADQLWFESVVKAKSHALRESSKDEEEESEDDTETQAAKRQ